MAIAWLQASPPRGLTSGFLAASQRQELPDRRYRVDSTAHAECRLVSSLEQYCFQKPHNEADESGRSWRIERARPLARRASGGSNPSIWSQLPAGFAMFSGMWADTSMKYRLAGAP
jgi:hypothetical protein